MPKSPTPLAVAMHEAGHAALRLAAPHLPSPSCMMLFEPGEDILGYVGAPALWPPRGLDLRQLDEVQRAEAVELATEDVRFYLAGPIAEVRWRRYPRDAIWLGAAEMAKRCLPEDEHDEPAEGTDLDRVRRRLHWAHPGRERAAFADAWIDTEERVALLWPRIVALGRRLHAVGALDEAELSETWKHTAVPSLHTATNGSP